jgi:hypothetical protein
MTKGSGIALFATFAHSHIAKKPLAIKDDDMEGVGDCFVRQHRTLERSLAMTCTGLSAVASKGRCHAACSTQPTRELLTKRGDCHNQQRTLVSHIAQKPFAIPDDKGGLCPTRCARGRPTRRTRTNDKERLPPSRCARGGRSVKNAGFAYRSQEAFAIPDDKRRLPRPAKNAGLAKTRGDFRPLV